MKQLNSLMVLNLFLVATILAPFANGLEYSRKLDENTLPILPIDGEQKCGGCTQPVSPPPPRKSCPTPPPPALTPPSPPPAPKKPPTQYCPPPPSSFIYMTGPPGNLYPIDQYFNGAPINSFMVVPLFIGFGFLALLL